MEEKDLSYKELIKQRHPIYLKYIREVNDIFNAYDGDKMSSKIFRHKREMLNEYNDRVERTFRVNYLRFFVNLNFKGIFSNDERNTRDFVFTDPNKFIENIDRKGNNIDQLMKDAGIMAYLGRQSYLWVDNAKIEEFSEYRLSDVQPFVKLLTFENVVNWSEDRNGYYNWVLIEYEERLDIDPYKKAKEELRYILLTKTDWTILNKDGEILDKGDNTLGVVPIVKIVVQDVNRNGVGESSSKELLDLDIETMNVKSLYNAELYKILFNFLATSTLARKEDGSLDISETNIIEVSEDAKFLPQWLSPNITTLQEKREKIVENINEMIRISGFKGRDNSENAELVQTGVSKLFDFISTSETLLAITKRLETAEKKVWYFIYLFLNANKKHSEEEYNKFIPQINISYSKSFNIINFDKELSNLFQLEDKKYTKNIVKETRKLLVKKILNDNLPNEKLSSLLKEIDDAEIDLSIKDDSVKIIKDEIEEENDELDGKLSETVQKETITSLKKTGSRTQTKGAKN